MKIIHIIPDLWNGGAEKFTIDLCNELAKTEDVILCSFKERNEKMIFVKNISSKVKLVTLSKKKGFDLLFFLRFCKFLFNENPDVINTHLTAINYCLPILLFLKKIKVFHTIHSMPATEEQSKWNRKIKNKYFQSRRIIPISISKKTATAFIQVYKNTMSEIIYNGVSSIKISSFIKQVENEINSYKINQETKVFITIGNYTWHKNFELLIKVFLKLQKEEENVVLLIVGTDSSIDKNEWLKIASLKSKNTFMLGLKNNVADYLICSDVFCMSSLIEGMPMSILEAFSAGLPVLSTPAYGLPDIVHSPVKGLLTPASSEEKYYEMIKLFLKMPASQIEKIKENNLKDFKQKFSIEITKENYLNNYKKVCS